MLEFTRQLVQLTVSDDSICLAVLWAAERVGVSQDEARFLLRAALTEKQHSKQWPKGF